MIAAASGIHLKLDLDQIEALAPEREALWTRLEKASFLTGDEKREAAGYGSVQGGDAIKFAPILSSKYPGQPRTDSGEFDFGPQNDGGGIVPVADNPQFSPDKSGWHDYSVGPNLVCGSELNCSAQEMADQMSRYGVPGRDPSQPVENGGTCPVYDPRNGMFAGYVKTTVSEDGLTIVNETLPWHVLYDGQITRQALQAADGSWYVHTRGIGNNVVPGFNAVNEWQGPEIFRVLDKILRDSISRHHGVSSQ